MLILCILQIIASSILVNIVWWTARKFKININIHNIPIIIFYGLFLLGGMYLSLNKFPLYVAIGTLLGIITMISISLLNDEQENKIGMIKQLLTSFIVSLIWHQVVIFMVFFVLNQNKINLDSEDL